MRRPRIAPAAGAMTPGDVRALVARGRAVRVELEYWTARMNETLHEFQRVMSAHFAHAQARVPFPPHGDLAWNGSELWVLGVHQARLLSCSRGTRTEALAVLPILWGVLESEAK